MNDSTNELPISPPRTIVPDVSDVGLSKWLHLRYKSRWNITFKMINISADMYLLVILGKWYHVDGSWRSEHWGSYRYLIYNDSYLRYFYKLSWPGTVVVTLIFIPLGSLYNDVIWISGKVYVDYRIKRHTPLPVLYISPPPTLLNFYHYRDSSR